MKNNKIIYALTVTDIQTIANEELERDLSDNEIREVVRAIEEKINWYDVISDAITETISSSIA
ncbi:MAG TPA: hypothetical protein VFW07_12635 [Parafilimonas sp.]|nr:hypothetical protein [Parafilimonas sp.]